MTGYKKPCLMVRLLLLCGGRKRCILIYERGILPGLSGKMWTVILYFSIIWKETVTVHPGRNEEKHESCIAEPDEKIPGP